jgi:hypothetical protein
VQNRLGQIHFLTLPNFYRFRSRHEIACLLPGSAGRLFFHDHEAIWPLFPLICSRPRDRTLRVTRTRRKRRQKGKNMKSETENTESNYETSTATLWRYQLGLRTMVAIFMCCFAISASASSWTSTCCRFSILLSDTSPESSAANKTRLAGTFLPVWSKHLSLPLTGARSQISLDTVSRSHEAASYVEIFTL